MINLRQHPRLRGRLDLEDVLQDVWLWNVDRTSFFSKTHRFRRLFGFDGLRRRH